MRRSCGDGGACAAPVSTPSQIGHQCPRRSQDTKGSTLCARPMEAATAANALKRGAAYQSLSLTRDRPHMASACTPKQPMPLQTHAHANSYKYVNVHRANSEQGGRPCVCRPVAAGTGIHPHCTCGVRACVRACVYARVCACMCVCARVCVCARAHVCACVLARIASHASTCCLGTRQGWAGLW